MNSIKKVLSSSERSDRRTSSEKHAGLRSDEEASVTSRRSASTATAPTSAATGAVSGYSTGTERVPGSPTTAGYSTEPTSGRNSMSMARGRPSGDFERAHAMGHDASADIASAFDPKSASHRHTHLSHKLHETLHEHEVEEVQRLKTHERHITHVQHHVQPIMDEEHLPEVHHERNVPQTHIEERHISTDDDVKAFQSLNVHEDSQVHAPKRREVIDLGEKVNEVVHHHVHNIVQPILVKQTHHHHRIHTVIPSHHVTHEAPIVHQSISHQPISKAEFLKQGGALDAMTGHHNVDALFTGECTRKVQGDGEALARELKLKPSPLSIDHDHDHGLAETATA